MDKEDDDIGELISATPNIVLTDPYIRIFYGTLFFVGLLFAIWAVVSITTKNNKVPKIIQAMNDKSLQVKAASDNGTQALNHSL
jgi:hypothetical protein